MSDCQIPKVNIDCGSDRNNDTHIDAYFFELLKALLIIFERIKSEKIEQFSVLSGFFKFFLRKERDAIWSNEQCSMDALLKYRNDHRRTGVENE